MKTGALFFPATYPDAIAAGEYVITDGVRIGCVSCGVVQRVSDVELVHVCTNPACPWAGWIELLPAKAS